MDSRHAAAAPGAKRGRLAQDPLANAAAQVGDRWSLLIIWAAANGVGRFDDFHRELDVARNILAGRLRRLVDLGILEKRPVREGARRQLYVLTDKGESLRQVLEALRAWGAEWRDPPGPAAKGES